MKATKLLLCGLLLLGAACSNDDDDEIVLQQAVPTVSSITVQNLTIDGVTLKASVTNAGTSAVSEQGFCWSLSKQPPTTSDSKLAVDSESATFTAEVTDFAPEKVYYLRAYAVNKEGIGYGDLYALVTPVPGAPVLAPVTVEDMTTSGATLLSSITDNGTSDVTERGFCWSTDHQPPTIEDAKLTVEEATASLSAAFTDFELETVYYVRAYATNGQGTGYSDVYALVTPEPGIYSLEDLLGLAEARNNYAPDEKISRWKNKDGVFNIYEDIDLSSVDNFCMIERIKEDEVLEGNGKTISGLKINIPAEALGGRYGFVIQNNGVIRNLNIEGTIVSEPAPDNRYVLDIAGVCYVNCGVIYNCVSAINITMGERPHGDAAGISIGNDGAITKCINRGNITSIGRVCGIANGGMLLQCDNYGTITFSGDEGAIGGISVGYSQMLTCKNYGKVIGGNASMVGGITASASKDIQDCTNEGEVSQGANPYVGYCGGIVGYLEEGGRIIACVHNGSVESQPNNKVGGICGVQYGGRPSSLMENVNNGTVNGEAGTEENALGEYWER